MTIELRKKLVKLHPVLCGDCELSVFARDDVLWFVSLADRTGECSVLPRRSH
jgi:hypothetical protein